MSLPKRIKVKFPITGTTTIDLAQFTSIFHKWIREQTVPGLLIDVADYKHVPNGPGLMLIGHEGDYNIDLADGRPGLVYDHKRNWKADGTDLDTLHSRIQLVIRHALLAAQALENEAELVPAISLDVGNSELTFLDRLNTPNGAEHFEEMKIEIQDAVGGLYGSAVDISWVKADQRRPLSVQIRADGAPILASMLVGDQRIPV